MTPLLHQPHHDGSALYVENPHPALGDSVTLRVRVPAAYELHGLCVRSLRDGEPRIDRATIERADAHERWWRVPLLVHNPVMHYRFLLDRVDGGYTWLTAGGLFDRDVTDDHDFRLSTHAPPPAWVADSVVYEVFPDRFARSGNTAPLPDWATARDWYDDPVEYRDLAGLGHVYGGDLAGIEQHLDHIEQLGCTTIYLTPFFEAPSNHRYNARSFGHVDPLLGGDEALSSLSRAVHDRGMRLLGDLTTNHTGDEHEWFRAAVADPDAPEAAMYYWREHPDYVAWQGVPTLPKLNWSSAELAARLVTGPDSVVAHWLREPFRLDGWRVDVANMTGRYRGDDRALQVARDIRQAMAEVDPDTLLVAEHGHDHTPDLPGDGWHSVMNYGGFLKPLWQWLVDEQTPVADFLGLPVRIPRRGGEQLVAAIADFGARVGWPARLANFNLIDSHDTARLRTVCGSAERHLVGAGLMFTLPGTPMIFAGDEIGLTGVTGEDSRRPFPWNRPERWDHDLLAGYRELARLRHRHPALREGGLRWAQVDADGLVFLRESPTERLLVSACRAATEPAVLPLAALGASRCTARYGPAAAVIADGTLTLRRDRAALTVWSLD
ncbi:MAG TPA: alpha-amylase family glycosyl hydrolase [Jatrophihabitans sp.]|nr:alpha-amylase family glycosyl hydrolase [Jatrophihabitans sp.]